VSLHSHNTPSSAHSNKLNRKHKTVSIQQRKSPKCRSRTRNTTTDKSTTAPRRSYVSNSTPKMRATFSSLSLVSINYHSPTKEKNSNIIHSPLLSNHKKEKTMRVTLKNIKNTYFSKNDSSILHVCWNERYKKTMTKSILLLRVNTL
jgi:hypothetical protein